jgi:hypothetical protein
VGQLDVSNVADADFRPEALSLPLHQLHKLWAHDTIREAGKFSTSVVSANCPPKSGPVITTGAWLARAA